MTTAGVTYCWGSGVLNAVPRAAPRGTAFVIAGAPRLVALSAVYAHACGIDPSGTAHCWGADSVGQLGSGAVTNRSSSAVAVTAPEGANETGGLPFSSVSAGLTHSCGVATDGAALCWGSNYSGQFGDGRRRENRARPVPAAARLRFKLVSAGNGFTCGVTTTEEAYCWGANDWGNLGDGTKFDHSGPVAVVGGARFRSISAGFFHACGLTTSGVALCWGSNKGHQLGTGTLTDSPTPVPVAGGRTFVAISAGASHTCALTSTGAAYCWGMAGDGALGDGSSMSSPVPVQVAGGLVFTAISVGATHTCALAADGAAYCWGSNSEEELGDGSTGASSATPTRVLVTP